MTIGLLAKHFGGAAPIAWLETLTAREIRRWATVYDYQTTEEQIINEYKFPGDGKKPREVPGPRRLRKLVERRIEERRSL